MPLAGERSRVKHPERLTIPLSDYVDLVDWTGRAVRADKRGVITGPPPKLLTGAGLSADTWLESVRDWGRRMWGVVGDPQNVERAATARGVRWCRGKHRAAQMYRARAE